MAIVNGTNGNDFIHVLGDGLVPPPGSTNNSGATDLADTISSGNGGTDTIYGGGGNDIINFSSDLTSADRIDGGAGLDRLVLNASVGIAFNAASLTSIESIVLPYLFLPVGILGSQSLTFVDANVAAGASMILDGQALGDNVELYLDFSAETDAGVLTLIGGAGSDTIIGSLVTSYVNSRPVNRIDLSAGGSDTAIGAGEFEMGAAFDAGDRLTVYGGGAVSLIGDYSVGLTITGDMITNARYIDIGSLAGVQPPGPVWAYNFTLADSLIDDGSSLFIRSSLAPGLTQVSIKAQAETSGSVRLDGGPADETLIGGSGADYFFPGTGIDQFSGRDGDDLVRAGSGINSSDTIFGGAGTDTLTLDGDYTQPISIGDGSVGGFEHILLGSYGGTNHSYSVNISDAALAVGSVLTIDGSWIDAAHSLNVVLAFDQGLRFALTGGRGGDALSGGTQSDTLTGGAGNDTLTGGSGDDTYIDPTSGDVITELAGGGIDTIRSSTTSTLAGRDQVENLSLTGTANVNASGNFQANLLTGNAGNNILNGSTGADTMAGGAGNDIYYVDAAGDVTTEAFNQGTDLVSSSVSRTLSANIENLNLSGIAAIDGNGNTGANRINGNGSSNILRGYEGSDTLNGGGGNDILLGGSSSDFLNPGSDAVRDIIRFGAVSESTGSQRDIVTGMDLTAEDVFDFTVVPTSLAYVGSGALSLATINGDLATAVNAALAVNGAVLFDPNAGDLNVAGHLFIVVDGNGDGVYTPNQDYVVQLVNSTGFLSLDDFI
jgi:Ca2+-binding RTX toxin-like protein